MQYHKGLAPRSRSLFWARVTLTAICLTLPAAASEITFTIAGTVGNGSADSGYFGFTNPTYLNGLPFTLVYQINDQLGQQSSQSDNGIPYESYIAGTAVTSPATAVLTINGVSFTFGALPSKYAGTDVTSFAERYIETPASGTNRVEEDVEDLDYPPGGGYYDDYVDSRIAVPTGNPPMTTNYDWRSSFTYTLSPADQNSSMSGFLIRDETQPGPFPLESGVLIPQTITVSGLNASSPLPEPGTMALLFIGILACVVIRKRNARHALSIAALAILCQTSIVQAQSPHFNSLQPGEVEQLGNATARFDLNAIRLNPSLLNRKTVMQYFIGLNNCRDSSVQRAMQNELDYPRLAAYYTAHAAEILAPVSDTAGLTLFKGNTKGSLIWGKGQDGWDTKLKTLSLGEYDTTRQAFPISVSDKSKSFAVSGTLHVNSDRQTLDRTCPVAYDSFLRDPNFSKVLPSGYNVTVKPLNFNELPMAEADARKYIESVNSTKRGIFLDVDVHLRAGSDPPEGNDINFSGEVARVIAVNSGSGQIIGNLFDDHSATLPVVPPTTTASTALSATSNPAAFKMEISTVVYVALSSDLCGWPVTAEQRANIKRYMANIDYYGDFNDKSALHSEIGQVRGNINAHRLSYCENTAEHQQFVRRAATLWPKGPIAAPARQ